MTKYFYENCLEPLPDLRSQFSQKVKENANLTWALLGTLLILGTAFSTMEAMRKRFEALQAHVKALQSAEK